MAIPVLQCPDLEAALSWYRETLGAQLLWRNGAVGAPAYAAVRWREHELHLSSHAGDGAVGSAVYFPVANVDAVFAELRARGWTPRTDRGPVFERPTDQTWGARELYVLDPAGNCLRFAA